MGKIEIERLHFEIRKIDQERLDRQIRQKNIAMHNQGCIFCLTCSYPDLTEGHVLTSAYVKIFGTATRNALNKSV